MISPKLQMLQRQLSQAGVNVPHSDSNLSSNILAALSAAVDEEAGIRVQAAKEQQHKAEVEIATLRREITSLRKELEGVQKDAENKIIEMQAAAHKERDVMCKSHREDVQQLQHTLATVRRELAVEQQARVRAETETQAAGKMQVHLENMVAKMKPVQQAVQAAPAQVIMPPATPMRNVTMRVSQRDANGHILAISIAPTT